MSFDFVPPDEFFELLYQETEFCDGVGKTMLSASRLETNLRRYLKARGIRGIGEKSTLGTLVNKLKDHGLLTRNGVMHFDDLVLKRNYLAHSLYDLFSAEIEETILPRDELVEMDADIFSERAQDLASYFSHFAKMVSEANPNDEKLL